MSNPSVPTPDKSLEDKAAALLQRKNEQEKAAVEEELRKASIEGDQTIAHHPMADSAHVNNQSIQGQQQIEMEQTQIPQLQTVDNRQTGPLSMPKSGDDEYVAIPQPLSAEEVNRRMAQGDTQNSPAKVTWPGASSSSTPPAPVQQENLLTTHDTQLAKEPPTPVDYGDADDSLIITSNPDAQASTPEMAQAIGDEVRILGDDAIKEANALPEDARTKFFSSVVPEMKEYQKELITKYGFSPEEAASAAKARATKRASEEVVKYNEDNPHGTIITIDKSQEESAEVQFTEEERAKIQRSRALKLVVVESAELEQLRIKPENQHYEMSNIRDICDSLSQYSIPLLSFGDYATFRGAQSGVLASCTASEDDTMLDAIEKKATLLYTHFGGSKLISKYDANGKQISYDEFCNLYHYEDIDLGVYAIVTASAMETTETLYTCQNPNCGRLYQIKYNQKALLDMSNVPDVFQKRIKEIDAARSSWDEMKRIHDEAVVNTRVRSPLSHNVYEFCTPTISEVRHSVDAVLNRIDNSTALDLVLMIYLSNIWVYDPKNEDYFPPISIKGDPIRAFETICSIHQVDLELLSKFISQNRYVPYFKIKTKCPYCGREEVDNLSVDNMVFLHARGTLTEIK